MAEEAEAERERKGLFMKAKNPYQNQISAKNPYQDEISAKNPYQHHLEGDAQLADPALGHA